MSIEVSRVAVVVRVLGDFFGSEIQGINPPPLPDQVIVSPYIVVKEIHEETDQDLEGSTGLEMSIMQIEVWHGDYSKSASIRQRAQKYLNDFSGVVLGVTVQAATHRNSTEFYDGVRQIWQHITRMNIGFEEV